MDEPVCWVTKAKAARELEVSLSTLDRKIRKGEVEAVKRDRRVYARMHGPEHLSDDDLLSRAIDRVDDLEQTVLRGERDEARDAASASEEAHRKVETAYGEERTAEPSGWPGPSASSPARCSRCWPSASLWRGVCSRKN